MHLSIHSKSPGFEVQMITIPSGIESDQNFFSKLSQSQVTGLVKITRKNSNYDFNIFKLSKNYSKSMTFIFRKSLLNG